MSDTESAWDFSFETLDGKPLPLAGFKGKAVLVVNTASQCGFTPQYKGLEALNKKYRDRGLVVLGVPCNDFGGQEPGSATEIQAFCDNSFSVTFPLTAKTRVKGSDAHPFYTWARQKVGMLGSPKWNFHKYLIAPDGSLADWFSTPTAPDAPRMLKAIEKVLPGKA
jgi:glutathione peroxidase